MANLTPNVEIAPTVISTDGSPTKTGSSIPVVPLEVVYIPKLPTGSSELDKTRAILAREAEADPVPHKLADYGLDGIKPETVGDFKQK